MTTFSRPLVLAFCGMLAGPVGAGSWWLESQQGDVLRIVPQVSGAVGLSAGRQSICLHDLTGNSRKGFSLAEGPSPRFVAEAGASTCADTVARPQVVHLWREISGDMREVLRLSLRAEDMHGPGLRIDWLAD